MGDGAAESVDDGLPNVKNPGSVKAWIQNNTNLPLEKGSRLWRERLRFDPFKKTGRAGLSGRTVVYNPHGDPAEVTSEIIHEVKAWNLGEGMLDSYELRMRKHAECVRQEIRYGKKTGVKLEYLQSQIKTVGKMADEIGSMTPSRSERARIRQHAVELEGSLQSDLDKFTNR